MTAADPDERPIGRWDFEDGSYVRIAASPDVDIDETLDMVEIIVDLKRKEIGRKRALQSKENEIDSD